MDTNQIQVAAAEIYLMRADRISEMSMAEKAYLVVRR